jgi:Lon protease-like protein
MTHGFDASLLTGWTAVFPLPNCVLLPGGVLPLHVFEPRYRAMVADVLIRSPERRLLAIAKLEREDEDLYLTNHAPIHPVVCVGQMVQHAYLPDGCINILTVGRARAKIIADEGSGVYRRARLSLLRTEPDNMLDSVDDAVDRVRGLLAKLADAEHPEPCEVAEEILRKAPTAATLVDLAAFHLLDGQDALLKQRILEEEQLTIRADILAEQLQAILDCRDGVSEASAGECWPPQDALN